MTISISITESQVFTALRAYILGLVAPSIEVVRGLDNRVPMPAGEFVALSPAPAMQQATPVSTYDPVAGTQTITQSTQFVVQVDCYGPGANDRAKILSAVFRTPYACDALAPNCAPLYASDPQQLPLTTGEEQFLERWTFNAVMQYNPSVTLTQDSATALSVTPKNVDVNFKP